MKKISYLKNISNEYFTSFPANDYCLEILGDFLTNDVLSPEPHWKNYILAGNKVNYSGNICWIDRIDNTIYLGSLLDLMDGIEDEEHTFVCSVDKICHILDQWDELRKQKPNYIIISREPEGVELTGVDEMPEEYKQYLQDLNVNWE